MSDERELEGVEEALDLLEQDDEDQVLLRLKDRVINPWGHSETAVEAKKAAMAMLSTKTGMHARIPMCQDSCPYAEACVLLKHDMAPMGELCPMEAANVELRYKAYEMEFKLGGEDVSFVYRVLVNKSSVPTL